MFEVKFGTPKPILFRECFAKDDIFCDLDLTARFAGRCYVSEYDTTRYEDEKAVDAAIKANASEIILKCLNEDWAEGTSKVWNCFPGIEKYFDKELENYGIKGSSEFVIKNLTPDSEEEFNDWRSKSIYNRTDIHWDRANFDNITSNSGNVGFR